MIKVSRILQALVAAPPVQPPAQIAQAPVQNDGALTGTGATKTEAIWDAVKNIIVKNSLQEQYKANKSIAGIVATKIQVLLQNRGGTITENDKGVTISLTAPVVKELAKSFVYNNTEGRKVRDGYLPAGSYPDKDELLRMYPNALNDPSLSRTLYNQDRFEK